MDPKEKLYYLLSEFNKGNYSIITFCDQFSITYDTEINYNSLSETECLLFKELADVTARFSQYEEDLKLPNVFFNETQVKQKVEEVVKQLSIHDSPVP